MSSIESYLSELNVGSIAVLYRKAGDAQWELTRADLVRACEKLAARHPSLRRAIATSATGAHRFLVDASKTLEVSSHVHLGRLDPADDVRPVPTDGKWLQRFQAELHRAESFALGRPPWSVVVLVGDHAVVSFFYFTHAIGDGMSGVIAQHDLLALLQDGRTAAELHAGLPVTAELQAAFGPSWLRWMLAVSVSSLAGSVLLRKLLEPRWLFLPHLMHKFAPVPRPVPAEVLQYTGVRRGTADGFRRLRAACKLRGVTIGGFVATALTFIGAAVEPAAKLGDSDAHDGGAPPPTTGNAAAHTAIAASARRISLGLSYDINWRDRLAEPQGTHARKRARVHTCMLAHTHERIGARKGAF